MKALRNRNLPLILLLAFALCLFHGIASAEDADAPAESTAKKSAPAEEASTEEESPGKDPDSEEGDAKDTGEKTEEGNASGAPGGGKKPAGGRSGGGRGGKSSQNSSGITPGKALTSSHAKGSRDMLRHGAVALTTGIGSMDTLVLGGKKLTLSCSGHTFLASLEDDVLILRSAEGDEWSLTMDVLKTLQISGIRQLRLIGPEEETVLNTDLELSGAAYGRERAQGFVSSDFLLLRRNGDWIIRVDGREYRLAGSELA